MNKFKLDPSVCNWEFLYQTLDTRSKNEFNIEIIDMSKKYENMKIWQDHNHVAFNLKSEIVQTN